MIIYPLAEIAEFHSCLSLAADFDRAGNALVDGIVLPTEVLGQLTEKRFFNHHQCP